jgi:CRP-like cAMP-binding protein
MDKTELVKMLSANAHAQRFRRGDVVVHEGAPAKEGLCFVLTGSVRIVQHQGDQVIPLGLIQTGQFFGETALLLNRTRTATAIADSAEVIIIFLNRDRFMAEAHNNYHLIRVMSAEAIERIERVIQTIIRLRRPVQIRIDPTLQPIIAENRASNLKIPQLLNHTRTIFIGHDKQVFAQGQRNDGLIYLVTEGVINAQRNFDGNQTDLYQFEAGDFLGYSRPSNAVFREYSAVAMHDTARVINFDEELLFRLMRLDIELFFNLFRTILTHLLILDDSLRLAVSEGHISAGSEQSQQIIAAALSEGILDPEADKQ